MKKIMFLLLLVCGSQLAEPTTNKIGVARAILFDIPASVSGLYFIRSVQNLKSKKALNYTQRQLAQAGKRSFCSYLACLGFSFFSAMSR